VPIVLVTGLAGWIFGWLTDRCGSLAAPILVHLAINESGALAAVAVQRRSGMAIASAAVAIIAGAAVATASAAVAIASAAQPGAAGRDH
jgi:hypothetical protein